jgi:hypothetical protein
VIELFAIRHGLPTNIIARWDFARVLQLLHAEGIRAGAMFDWAHYFTPSPEEMADFEEAPVDLTDWSKIEPEFSS